MKAGAFISLSLALGAAAACLVAGCLAPSGPVAGSESHFLGSCEAGCGDLECICGVCTTPCETGDSCRELGAASLCVFVEERPPDSSCHAPGIAAFCDLPCLESADCSAAGKEFFCLEGYCREDPFHTENEPFPGYGTLCEAIRCIEMPDAPSLLGSFTGEGRVTLSSNPLWSVGETESFEVQVARQEDGTVSGAIRLNSLDLVVDGFVRGEANSFSIYSTGSVLIDDCNVEARVVIAGEIDDTTSPPTIAGELALRFTGNFEGDACTQEQKQSYPGTGANFEHVAALVAPQDLER